MKISKTHHIRKKGSGKNKIRKNPQRTRGKFGPVKKEKVYNTMFLQDKKSGLLKGRKRVLGKGDGTIIQREGKAGRILGRVDGDHKSYTGKLNKIRYS